MSAIVEGSTVEIRKTLNVLLNRKKATVKKVHNFFGVEVYELELVRPFFGTKKLVMLGQYLQAA